MARPKHISDVLYSGIGGEQFQDRLAQMRVLREWGEVVGPRVAQVTRAVSVRNGVLTVAVRGAVWKAEIEFLSDEILRAINGRLSRNALSGIRLTSGYRGQKPREAERPDEALRAAPEVRIGGRQRRHIERAVSVITDAKLRTAVAGAWETMRRLAEMRRLAGRKRCRACGEYGAWREGICRACALDVISMAGSTATGDTNGGSD